MTVNLSPIQRRRCEALDLLISIAGVSNEYIGERVGVSGANVRLKRTGGGRLVDEQGDLYATALEVPGEVMSMELRDVLLWLSENTWWIEMWAARDSNPEPTGSEYASNVVLLSRQRVTHMLRTGGVMKQGAAAA